MSTRLKAYGCLAMFLLFVFSTIIIPFGLDTRYGVNELYVPAIGLSVFWGLVILISLVRFIGQIRVERKDRKRLSQARAPKGAGST